MYSIIQKAWICDEIVCCGISLILKSNPNFLACTHPTSEPCLMLEHKYYHDPKPILIYEVVRVKEAPYGLQEVSYTYT